MIKLKDEIMYFWFFFKWK